MVIITAFVAVVVLIIFAIIITLTIVKTKVGNWKTFRYGKSWKVESLMLQVVVLHKVYVMLWVDRAIWGPCRNESTTARSLTPLSS